MKNIKLLIEKERNKFLLKIPSGMDSFEISTFSKKFEDYFGEAVDRDYLSFLEICDGLEENGFVIYSSANKEVNDVLYGVFENNELWYEQDSENQKYIYFAESGQDVFVFDKGTKQYYLIDRYNGEVIEIFKSFNEMLEYILKLMIS